MSWRFSSRGHCRVLQYKDMDAHKFLHHSEVWPYVVVHSGCDSLLRYMVEKAGFKQLVEKLDSSSPVLLCNSMVQAPVNLM